ncbi:hypothetical protein JCM33374_g1063 [Metschnikowia sp. JCM 33374]|nr:hypothetical protein JCM33374_g1063 [Metschnikowia sp. JCM 33374]
MRPTKITGFPWAVLLTSLTAAKATGQLSTLAPPYADAGVSNTVSSYNLHDSGRCLGNPNDPEEKPTISHVIHNFKVMLVRLGLTQYIDELYFSELLEEGTEKELHAKVNITRQVFKASYVDKANMAYSGQTKEGRRIPKTKSAGEEFGFLRSFEDNYVMLGIISGHSDWLPSDQDSTSICDTMVQHTQNLYANLVDKTDISAYDILGLAWRTMPQEHNFDPGCFSALYAIINPRKEIELANLRPGVGRVI